MVNQGEIRAKIEISMQELLAVQWKLNSSKSLSPDEIHQLQSTEEIKKQST